MRMRLQFVEEPGQTTDLGAVYTPTFLAEWVAQELLDLIGPRNDSPRVLDPACGDGALLEAVHVASGRKAELFGIDVDKEAINQARERLGESASLILADALFDPLGPLSEGLIDAVIANPPWGVNLSAFRDRLKHDGYQLARGQCDSFELFIERCVREARTGTPMAFIVPDSIFLPEHEPLRQFLVEKTSLKLMARLGEGFFPGVFRGTVVMLFVTGSPSGPNEISCMRLPVQLRRKIFKGTMKLAFAKRKLVHVVRQERFRSNIRFEFDIDVRNRESRVISKFNVRPLEWTRWLQLGRGVELGKSGLVICCEACGLYRPAPRGNSVVTCKGCGAPMDHNPKNRSAIVRPLTGTGSDSRWPLIVGEDVGRYSCSPSREIALGIPGIQYKPHADFLVRKLLVRKTGIGLKAAIDESGSYTNQVVFHFIPREGAPEFLLDYMLGILCSRIMLAFHLRRSGENEWRSHPYVTPKILASLPIPDFSSSDAYPKAKEIAAVARSRTLGSSESDLQVDRLVADLFRLTKSDCAWVASVLDSAQSLQSIAPLRVSDPSQLHQVRGTQNGLSLHRQ